MASTTFAQFLERHRAALIPAMIELITATTPTLLADERVAYTERVVATYITYCLGETTPTTRSLLAESQRRGVTPAFARRRSARFIELLTDFCQTDPLVTEAEKPHILRMLEASRQYLASRSVGLQSFETKA